MATTAIHVAAAPDDTWAGHVGPPDADPDALAMNLLGEPDYSGAASARRSRWAPRP